MSVKCRAHFDSISLSLVFMPLVHPTLRACSIVIYCTSGDGGASASPQLAQGQVPLCDVCNKPLGPVVAKVMGKRLHPQCFKCYHCDRVIEDKEYTPLQGQAFCGDLCANLRVCDECQELISRDQALVVVEGAGSWHRAASCFKCGLCEVSLVDGSSSGGLKKYVQQDGLVLCQACDEEE